MISVQRAVRLARPAVAGVFLGLGLCLGLVLAACSGPVGSAFSEPEIRIEPPPNGTSAIGLSEPSSTQF